VFERVVDDEYDDLAGREKSGRLDGVELIIVASSRLEEGWPRNKEVKSDCSDCRRRRPSR
jgi:hypothetical protein